MAIWIYSDNNIDHSPELLQKWAANQTSYHSLEVHIEPGHLQDSGIFDWSTERFSHLINLREKALLEARQRWADYIWFLDSDAFITNPNTLSALIEQNKPVIAPMLESVGAYSNYWCGMDEKGFYLRTDEYRPILERTKTGCFPVPMVHSATLVDLRDRRAASQLTFNSSLLPPSINYTGPFDDIIIFAHSANYSGVGMYVLNTLYFGYILMPMDSTNTLEDDHQQLINLKVEVMAEDFPMPISPLLQDFIKMPEPDTLGFDQVYLINLARRPDRRQRMENTLRELGVAFKMIPAVDGRNLTEASLAELGVKMLPGYSDPIKKRPLTMGEIGCFLSHYSIWKEVVESQHRAVLVFEDDLRFQVDFRRKLQELVSDMSSLSLNWDLVYLGRKRLSEKMEPFVAGTQRLVHVEYSYWTLGYFLTRTGAKKLIESQPMEKMVPVDEFLPLIYDKHPNEEWKAHFPQRTLQAYSAYPLLVYPTHYTGDENYISDTEDSSTVHDEL